MAKKKTKKKEEEVISKPFDYTAYIEKTITKQPKAFLYYIISNKITLNTEKDVEKAYTIFKQGG